MMYEIRRGRLLQGMGNINERSLKGKCHTIAPCGMTVFGSGGTIRTEDGFKRVFTLGMLRDKVSRAPPGDLYSSI